MGPGIRRRHLLGAPIAYPEKRYADGFSGPYHPNQTGNTRLGESLMEKLFDREISILEFNARVLAEAMDPSNPLLERLKFIGIVSSNMDEFFMVRIASLKAAGSPLAAAHE